MLPYARGTVPDESSPAPECSDRGLFVVLVLCGLMPFLMPLITGVWREADAAVGGLLLLLALAGRLGQGACRDGRREHPRVGTRAQD